VTRYGRAEVERWYWEVWNEPNIGYRRDTPDDFRKLHDCAIDAVRRALPTAHVGGPDVAGPGGQFMRDFLEHCLRGTNHATGKQGTPLDFVSLHAKGAPAFLDGHVRMGIANQLRAIDSGLSLIAGYPELKGKPVIIGESDPDGCAACQGPHLGYRNGALYASYIAASSARKHEVAERHGVNLEGALTWAFEFEDQPYFAGFRALATNGIDLPVLNVFRMFAGMRGRRVAAESTAAVRLDRMLKDGVRAAPDVAALATLKGRQLALMVWHYHDDEVPGPDAALEVQLRGLPRARGAALVRHYRIDEDHSNAFTAWKRMGSPQTPTPEQYAKLEHAARLAQLQLPSRQQIEEGRLVLRFTLPRQAVSLIMVDC
jgi:xylan 1,4-beta-xylosidase